MMPAEKLDWRRTSELIARLKKPEGGAGWRQMEVTQDIPQPRKYSSRSVPFELPTRIAPLVACPEREQTVRPAQPLQGLPGKAG
jgi:hypothetical protein